MSTKSKGRKHEKEAMVVYEAMDASTWHPANSSRSVGGRWISQSQDIMGAFDFVPKGTDTIKTLVPRVRNAVRERFHAQETKRLHAMIEQQNIRLREQVDKLRDACQLLSQQAEIIQEDFNRAAGIQRALLPREAPEIDGVVYVTGEDLSPGEIVPCEIVAAREYDLIAAAVGRPR